MENIFMIIDSMKILNRALTKNELKPWWNNECKEKSNKLWLPITKKERTRMKDSWFNTIKQNYDIKQPPKISFPNEEKERIKYFKTIKIRLFPTEEEKVKIQKTCDLFKWYYNDYVYIFNNLKTKIYSYTRLVKEIKQWKIEATKKDNLLFLDPIRSEENKFQQQDWMKGIYYERIPRGAIFQLSNNVKSAVSNLKNGNITHFNMKYKRKKNFISECLFEDSNFPSWIKKIRGLYKQKRNYTSFEDCLDELGCKGGITLIHDKLKDKYYVHLPVESRTKNENIVENQDIISLDTGVRTFQTGYSPSGHVLEIGKNDYLKINRLLRKTYYFHCKFKRTGNEKHRIRRLNIFRKIKNMITDLHWKTISYLTDNYKVILLPDFRVMNMICKNNITRNTKRLLLLFSFYTFKQRLLWKAKIKGNTVIIVNESYTSKTCGCCGELNEKLKSKKYFNCKNCGLKIDRDVNGARNILLKHI